jgi:hypothetical protein
MAGAEISLGTDVQKKIALLLLKSVALKNVSN